MRNGCFSPDGKLIYLSAWSDDEWDPAVRIYDAETFECIRTVVLKDETSVFRISPDPDGRRLYISFGNRKKIMIMDTETCELSEGFDPGQDRSICMSFDPSGRLMATASMESEGSIKLWKLPELELLETLQPSEKVIKDLAFSEDGCVLFACVGSNVQTWEIRWKLEF